MRKYDKMFLKINYFYGCMELIRSCFSSREPVVPSARPGFDNINDSILFEILLMAVKPEEFFTKEVQGLFLTNKRILKLQGRFIQKNRNVICSIFCSKIICNTSRFFDGTPQSISDRALYSFKNFFAFEPWHEKYEIPRGKLASCLIRELPKVTSLELIDSSSEGWGRIPFNVGRIFSRTTAKELEKLKKLFQSVESLKIKGLWLKPEIEQQLPQLFPELQKLHIGAQWFQRLKVLGLKEEYLDHCIETNVNGSLSAYKNVTALTLEDNEDRLLQDAIKKHPNLTDLTITGPIRLNGVISHFSQLNKLERLDVCTFPLERCYITDFSEKMPLSLKEVTFRSEKSKVTEAEIRKHLQVLPHLQKVMLVCPIVA
jgi:hypothetical protein